MPENTQKMNKNYKERQELQTSLNKDNLPLSAQCLWKSYHYNLHVKYDTSFLYRLEKVCSWMTVQSDITEVKQGISFLGKTNVVI